MTNPEIFSPDFRVSEEMANQGTLQSVGFYHATDETVGFVEAWKEKEGEQGYSFVWLTESSSTQIADLMDNADKLPEINANSGTFIVFREDIPEPAHEEYRWFSSGEAIDSQNLTDVEGLDITDSRFLRLDIEENESALVWHDLRPNDTRTTFGIITSEDIESPWIKEVYNRTVEEKTREIVDGYLGELVTSLNTFLELPFGECSLETGFTESTT